MGQTAPTLDILICTIGTGVETIPRMMLPERQGVRYVISVQHTGPASEEIGRAHV